MTTDNVNVSRELLRQVLDALKFFASEMTVGQRYTNHGQTAIDAPVEIQKLLEQPAVESVNLNCKSVQKRLATQWGYVEAQQPAVEPDNDWRKLAQQFDAHRMQAIWHLKAMTQDPQAHMEKAVEFLLAAMPLTQQPTYTAEQIEQHIGYRLPKHNMKLLLDLLTKPKP